MSTQASREIGVGIVGSRFMAMVHRNSLRQIPGVRVHAVASPTAGHAERFAAEHGISRWFADYREMLTLPDLDVVIVTTPNDLHAQPTIDAARAGKHVIVEKPLCLSLDEADRMIAACREAGVKLMYAEEFCFAPKYVRVKEVIDEGAIGRVFRVNYNEKSRGPTNPWYWDLDRSGGWATMQLGSHAIEIVRWILGKPRATSVYAQVNRHVHGDRGRGDDDAMVILEFEGGLTSLVDVSWAKLGGGDDRMEVFGTGGVSFADLYFGNAFRTYSEKGYAYSGPGGAPKTGWTYTVFDELYNNGFPQEIAHFIACVRDDLEPMETGEDGRAVLEIIMAAYESARTGRKVPLPFRTHAARPIDLLHSEPADGGRSL